MLTKKENLLIRPFVVQKYRNHRRKVEEAGAVIDFQSPTQHPHVTLKLKKLQKERERLQEIERENQRLLTKLGQIMNKNRLENFWKQPRPDFLNRVAILPISKSRSKSAPVRQVSQSTQSAESTASESYQAKPKIRVGTGKSSSRCPTCSMTYVKKNQVIPEERVPWVPPKKSWNYKICNDDSHIHKCCKFCC